MQLKNITHNKKAIIIHNMTKSINSSYNNT